MNRRRVLNTVHRSLARKQGVNAVAWFSGQSFHQSAADVPFERLSVAELDKAGPKLVTTLPNERAVCIYCCAKPASGDNFPYCSPECGINSENS